MKKILLAVMAVAAIGFTSCGNKTQQGEAVDSVALVDSISSAVAQEDIDAISGLLEAGDPSKLQEALDAVKEKIAALVKENPEVAKEYVAKVQTFLKDNADKVKAVVGDNAAVQATLNAVTEVEPASVVSNLIGDAKDAANEAADSVEKKVNDAKEAAVQAAEDKANEVKDAAKEKAGEAVDAAADKAKKALGL